jgi:hypothetical protein
VIKYLSLDAEGYFELGVGTWVDADSPGAALPHTLGFLRAFGPMTQTSWLQTGVESTQGFT